ncbi:MAG: 23S rRNA (adenine(1618)-N(6))-methyltransferase RlmF [Flavobacteriales bacterium]|nr:MAG: 23S rRNA (adenine(1618)-N(6))-methyltransferase RlmF [Flavobacteriales bacterium]
MQTKRKHPKVKAKLHPKNKHNGRYNLQQLIATLPELNAFVKMNEYGDESIDFFNPEAVLTLNKALLKHYYDIHEWTIPNNYLCPPIPSRADYIHHIAQLLGESNYGKIPIGENIKCLDVGVGANCVYPIIGSKEYGWLFIGADTDQIALDNAQFIVDNNDILKGKVQLILQENPKDFFYGILKKEDQVDLTICNPPYHASQVESSASTIRKLKNLKKKSVQQVTKNFGGQNSELWCDGGENKFVRNMMRESKKFGNSCFWFSTLISKQSNVESVLKALRNEDAAEIKVIPMGQGNKTSRIIAWTFLTPSQQKEWREKKWI